MEKNLLMVFAWLLLLGGLLLMLTWVLAVVFGDRLPIEIGVAVIGGGLYLLASAIVLYIRKQVA